MQTENRILEVGDVLYNAQPSNNFARPTKKIIIDRVTATQATSEHVRVQREPKYGRYSQIGCYDHFYFGDDDSEAKYQQYLAEKKLERERKIKVQYLTSHVSFRELTDDQLSRILSIVNEPKQ